MKPNFSNTLAISQRHRLLFVSHSHGFFVAKTADVIEAAKEIKEKGKEVMAVEDVSVVDVKIGRVSILAVSGDESVLATVIGGEIFFFPVLSLIDKEQEPSFSCSLNGAGNVKDFKWQKSTEKSFVVLSSHGSLYHGILETKLKNIMDNVDAEQLLLPTRSLYCLSNRPAEEPTLFRFEQFLIQA